MQAQTLTPQSASFEAEAHAEIDELAQLPWMIRSTAICFVSTAIGWILGDISGTPAWLPWVFYAVAFISGGWFTTQEAWDSIKRREFDVNVLMIVAALGAAAVGQPREGAILMFLFSLSNTLETYAMGRTHAAVNALLDMSPQEATLMDGEQLRTVHVETLQVGNRVLIRPGERIPVDGMIKRGESAIDEAAITGESMPVEKRIGSNVFAGTLNTTGSLEVEVRTPAGDTTLARIVQTVAEARQQKASAQDFTDRVIGQYYAYAVVVMTLLAIIIPLVFLNWDFKTTLYRAMALMVVASPCALVISIPAAMLSAMASSARRGVLFKGGRYLEAAAKIKVVAMDKTGTVTTGQLNVTAVEAFAGHTPDQVLRLAAAVEQLSEHPLAQAVVRGAQAKDIRLPQADGFKAITGMGAEAIVEGRTVRIGRPTMFSEDIVAQAAHLEEQGNTVIVVGDDTAWGMIALADTMRPEARAAIQKLKDAGVQKVVLLTGDNRRVANSIAKQLGIDEVRAELLPEDKVTKIKELQAQYGATAMIGDGVNDAPALATAELGIAMGVAGTDVALQSADVLLMRDDLMKVADAISLGKRTQRIVWQNIAFAGSVIIVLVISALLGKVALPFGVVGHEGSTLLVVLNGLRLLRK